MNNKLQIAVDPSCLQIKTQAGKYQMQVSLSITGLSFDNISNDTEYEAAKQILKEYNTYLLYDKVRVIFLDDQYSEKGYKDLDVKKTSGNDAFRAFIANEIEVNITKKEQLLFLFKNAEHDIDITKDDFDDQDNYNPRTGYSNSVFANFSQLLPPLNEQVGLAYFAESYEFDDLPQGTNYFIAFPYYSGGGGVPVFSPASIDGKMLWKCEYGNTPIPGEPAIVFDHRYISMLTEIPTGPALKGNIDLRDGLGSFEGSVKIDVFQEHDWTRDYAANIGSYFRFQVLLDDFLTQPANIAVIAKETDNFQPIIESFECLLWRFTLEPFFPYIKPLPSGKFYFGQDQETLFTKEQYANWVDSIKGISKLKDLVSELKFMLLTEFAEDGATRIIKKEYETIWKVSSDPIPEITLLTPAVNANDDNLYKTNWLNKWSENWANVIEASRQITNLDTISEDATPELLTGDKLLQKTLDFINANNTFNNHLNFGEISYMAWQYEQAVYLNAYQTSNLGSISGFLENLIGLIPQFWDDVKNAPLSLLTTVFPQQQPDILQKEFKKYLAKSVEGIKSKIIKDTNAANNTPPVRIKVHPNTWIHSGSDDISDEIAGFILLNQRGSNQYDDSTFNNTWNHLNITKPRIDNAKGQIFTLGNDPTQPQISTAFLYPASLPEINGIPLLSLSVSNEKRSIAEPELTLYYTPENKTYGRSVNNQMPYSMDLTSPEYWYGYYYRFAGFVALNSGALPPVLRHNGEVNIFDRNPALTSANSKITTYHHLRKVAFTTPNISPQIKARLFEYKEPPADFQPLAKELSFWQHKDYKHYTLSGSVNFNKQITFNVAKATTSVWDWFASEKKTLKEILNYAGTDALLLSVQQFLKRKNEERAEADGPKLPDPLAADLILVEWRKVHPYASNFENFTIDTKNLHSLTVCWDVNTTGYKPKSNTLTVTQGEIIEVSFYTLVDKKHFDTATQMIDDILHPGNSEEHIFNSYYKFASKSFCFESARHPQHNLPKQDLAQEIWELITISDDIEGGKATEDANVQVFTVGKQFSADPNRDITKYISPEFAYVSELKIKHQRWNWDGRLDVSGCEDYFDDKEDLDPKYPDYVTTKAMKWEAWSFSNRPDDTGSLYRSHLKISNLTIDGKEELQIADQQLCSLGSKGETKALYHRFAVTAYSRYKFLDDIAKDIAASVPIAGYVAVDGSAGEKKRYNNQWKRFLQLAKRTEALPTPIVRFFIPLTESINSEKATEKYQNAGTIMAVLEGSGFDESGLAYGLEVGIDKVSYINPANQTETYLNFGTSPTHSINGSKQVATTANNLNTTEYLSFIPQGPVGFTFDTGAENPKITSSAVFIDLADEKLSDAVKTINGEYQAWSLMRVAIRSVVRGRFSKLKSNLSALTSKWSDKSWVEFLLAANFFIPRDWIKAVNQHGYVELASSAFTTLPVFDAFYEETIVRYVVITKTESDIGGIPVESYFGTYHYNTPNNALTRVHGEAMVGGFNGFVRILVVSKERHKIIEPDENVWDLLFPNNNDKIKDDASVARPLITRRIPMNI